MPQCPYCFAVLKEADLARGKESKCPRCGYALAAVLDAEDEAASGGGRAPWMRPTTAIAFCFACVAILFAALPSLNVWSKPASLVGLIVGVIGILIAPAERASRAIPALICGWCIFSLLLVGPWPLARRGAGQTPQAVPLVVHTTSSKEPISAQDWVDAGANAIVAHDRRVQVVSARIGPVELVQDRTTTTTEEKYLCIRLRMSYEGVLFQKIAYEPWADLPSYPSKHPPTLTDDQGHAYTQKVFAPGVLVKERKGQQAMTPGHRIGEVLVYPAPVGTVEYLRLGLPASALGGQGEFKFELPRHMLASSPSSARRDTANGSSRQK